jgi:hypothetical protein
VPNHDQEAQMADPDTPSPEELRRRAAQLGRRLDPGQVAEMAELMAAVEPTLRALRTQAVGLLADGSDPAAGDAWLRPDRWSRP